MKYNLKNTTFIIPVKIESEDRKNNFLNSIRYINHNFDTNIFVLECDYGQKVPDLISQIKDVGINYSFIKYEKTFHRTKMLNMMLSQVKTSVVANYDIDVLFDIRSYLTAQKLIMDGKYDLIYPFGLGDYGYCVPQNTINLDDEINILEVEKKSFKNIYGTDYGFCQFFNTKSYKEGGMENENFLSYGPEDKERYHRFVKLGYKVCHLNGKIYHMEHSRTQDSNITNPHYQHNMNLFNYLKTLSKEKLKNYYNSQKYIKEY